MKNQETGGFNLVLGTGQLVSWLLMLSMLCAGFFVTGYKAGRNATPPAQLASNPEHNGIAAPANTRPMAASGTTPAGRNSPAAAAETPSTTQPALAPQPAPAASYLQTYAGTHAAAETFANTLKQRGFPTLLSPGPQGKTRVLVGPYADLGRLAQARAELERLGVSAFRQRIER